MRVVVIATVLATFAPITAVAAEESGRVGARRASVPIEPAKLPRGQDSTVPRVQDNTIIDAGVRIRLDAPNVYLLAESGADYLVWTGTWVLRVNASGQTRRLLRAGQSEVPSATDDGSLIVTTRYRPRGTTVVRLFDSSTGDRVAARAFSGGTHVLDADNSTAIFSSWAPQGTFRWNLRTNKVSKLTSRIGSTTSLARDLFGSFTKDPYEGGCTVVARLSAPKKSLWRSCRERVDDFSPNGRKMLTVHKLTDGRGPWRVNARNLHGRLLVAYQAPAYFEYDGWEDNKTVHFGVFGNRRGADVRCTRSRCERASGMRRAGYLGRVSGPQFAPEPSGAP